MARHCSFHSLVCITLLLAGVAFSTALRAESMVSVVRHSFCKDVANLEPVVPIGDPAALKPGERLHLWLEIQINRAGLKYLRALGKLPVYLRWGRDGWLTDPPLDIGIAPGAWEGKQDGIGWKAHQGGGTFTWRTHADKAAPIDGRYYASLLDANRKVIATIEFPTEPFRPEVTVKREQESMP